ncbi:MAG TPA: ribbon-helix-helix domain-containing protein [Devosiaceae bacterium]|nr:ribbon-helix-helix domain-containing protein [Devosiaceae bacterium]
MNYQQGKIADSPAGPSLASATAPQFKAVNLSSGRKGLRLETQFWSLLSQLAAKRGVRRSELIDSILEEAVGTEANAASALRCYVASAQADELLAIGERLPGAEVVRLLLKAPAPAFVVDRDKKLREANAEFIQIVRATAESTSQNLSADLIQLTLDVPVDELFARLRQPSGEARCGYLVQVDARQRRGQARILRVPSAPVPVLVGYILS